MPKPVSASVVALLTPLLLVACTVSGPLPASPSPIDSPSPAISNAASRPPAATPSPSPSASPTALPLLNLHELAPLRTDPTTVLAVCDPDAGALLYPESGDELVFCADGIEAGLRAIETVSDAALDRVYLDLPTCEAAPCTSEQLGTGTVTAWSGDAAWSTRIDMRPPEPTATPPVPAEESAWPTIDGPAPTGKPPTIHGAPAEIASRKSLPFCGASEMGEGPEVSRCFLAAVLAGRPAEMTDLQHGTEGGSSLQIARFGGVGPVVVYQQHLDDQGRTGPWFRQLARVIIGSDGNGWSPEPLSNTFRDLP